MQDLVFTASQDQTIRVWGVQQTAPCAHVIRAHSGPVSSISLHATGDYLLSSSTDGVMFPQLSMVLDFCFYYAALFVCATLLIDKITLLH